VWELPERGFSWNAKESGSNLQRNLRYNTCGCQEQFRSKHNIRHGKSKTSRRKTGENGYETMNDRGQAWGLLTEFTQSESLRKHGLAVEACMRAYARKLSGSPEEEEVWGVVGLLHDFDYEKYPSLDDHPYKGNEILRERGYSDEIRRAIMSHAEYSGVTRDSLMEKALFACDELAGFITACALVKPGKSLAEVEAKSVRKKMKDKAFARSVKREDIVNGAADLGVDLEEHIAFCIEALKGIADKLGLDGKM
jgi:putative nucleotidyltransferase with HDIG domain